LPRFRRQRRLRPRRSMSPGRSADNDSRNFRGSATAARQND
jgi:hypothetical protein